MEEFTANYKKLNTAQRLAVDTIDGPVLVIAGPGTGKTQLLSMRVANILRQTDTDPQNILCLTFTNKAALNMRERLATLIGPNARSIRVHTFHSFAAEIMNQYPDYFWSGARLSVAPDAVQDDIIQGILARLPLDNPLSATFAGTYTALSDVKNALKLAKEAGLTPDELRLVISENLKYISKIEPKLVKLLTPTLSFKKLPDLLAAVQKLPAHNVEASNLLLPLSTVIVEGLELAIEQDLATNKTKQTGKWKQRWLQTIDGKKGMFTERKRNEWWLAVSDVYEQYRQELHKRGYYDYADMLIEVLEQLQQHADMLADIQEHFLYVLIDEFQDTNAAQLRLAHLVADHYATNNRPNLMAVGDDDQSIFAFNGAELNNALGFRRSYPDSKLIVLTDNYRSVQPILDTATQIIEQAEDRLINREPSLSKLLVAQHKPAGKAAIEHLNYPTRAHQYLAVAERIKAMWKDGHKDIVVLARTHDSLQQLASILLKFDVPIRYERQSNVLEHEAVRQAHLIAKTAVAIAEGDKDIVNVSIAGLVRHPMWHLSPRSLWKLAIANYSAPDWLDSLLSSNDPELNKLGEWLVWLARTSNELPLPLVMEHILGLASGPYMESPLKDYYLKASSVTTEYIETLSAIQLLRGMTQEFASKHSTLSDFVRFVDLNLSTGRVIANESWFVSQEQAVQLLTIHKAKGLEFEQVFLVDAIESMWQPRSSRRASPANLQLQPYGEQYDDYVRLLYVAATRAKHGFIATSFATDDKGSQLLPTPLLSALPLTTITEPADKSVEVLEQDLHWPSLNSHDERVILKPTLESFALSPTSLIDFLNIAEAGPNSFKERHLLRLPHPRSASGSYGTAIHSALETAQRLINTSKLELGTVLDRFEATLRDEHLSPQDFKRYMLRGEKLLPKLLKQKEILLPKGGLVEQRINDVGIGQARIKGKLDRIDFVDTTLIIGDYKTGKPLSSFTTKDQTKAIKAWRHRTQLLFYALLAKQSLRFKAATIKAQMLYVEAGSPKDLVLSLEPLSEDYERLELIVNSVWKHIQKLNFPDISKYEASADGIRQFEDDLIGGGKAS